MTAPGPASPPSRWRRWIGRGLAGLLLTLIGAVAALVAVLSSEVASQYLLTQADLRIRQFHFASASGSVTRGLEINDLQLDLGELHLRVGQVASRWQFWELLRGRFSIDQLVIHNLDIDLPPPSDQPTPPGPWPNIASPLPLAIKRLDLHNLRITQQGTEQHFERIQLDARINPLGLKIKSLQLTRQQLQLQLRGQVAAALPYRLRLDLQWQYQLEPDHYSGAATLAGDLANLKVSHELHTPYPLRSDGKVQLTYPADRAVLDADSLSLSLHTVWPELKIDLAAQSLVTSGSLDIQGGYRDYSLALKGSIAAAKPPTATPQSSGNSADSTAQNLLTQAIGEPATLELNVVGNALTASLRNSKLSHPMASLSVEGDVDASGLLSGAAPLRWDAKATLRELDLAKLRPDWPARLSTDLLSKGYWQAGSEQAPADFNIDIRLDNLQGQLNDKLINGQLQANLTPTRQQLQRLQLALGDNRLSVSGARSNGLEMQWQLNAGQLADFYPGLGGRLHSAGKVSGSLASPTVDGRISGERLAFNEKLVDRLALHASVADSKLSLSGSAEGITAAVLDNANLTIAASGSQEKHHLEATLKNGLEQLRVGLTGGLQPAGNNAPGWQGLIDLAAIHSPLVGDWSLQQPAPLRAVGSEVTLENLCLIQADAAVCSAVQLADSKVVASLSASNISLENVIQGVPSGSGISGRLFLNASARGPVSAPTAQLQANIEQFELRYKPAEDEPPVTFPATFRLDASSDGKQADLQSEFTLGDIGSLRARASASALDANGVLDGRVDGQFSNLQWLGSILPQLEKLDGQLNSQWQLAGTVATPTYQGAVTVNQLQMDVPDIGLQLRSGQLQLGLDDAANWQLTATVNSKDSALALSGSGRLGEGGPEGKISLSADKFLLANTEEIRLVTSPAIEVNLTPTEIDIGGKIRVDDGHFVLTSLPSSAVGVSPDERIVSSHSQSQPGGRPLNLDLALSLDKQFKLEGFGLSTKLGGKLRLRQQGDGDPQGYGSLNLYDGLYKAYGQKLAVESGVLIFQGPLDNPGLNITAVREAKDATVGIRIGGYAQDIRSELFSDPAMSPTDTMAILITGKAPSQMNQDDANQVMNAATALGISQSAGISNTLKETFGLDVVSLQGGESYTESSLVVGKYLSPKLFVSYVQNLFTPAGAVQLEYSLTDNLGLKAESGKEQSIDLLYKVEHGK